MQLREIVDTIALGFDKSSDFAYKKGLAIDILAYRAVLVKQQIKGKNDLSSWLSSITIPVIKDKDGCFVTEYEIPDYISIGSKDLYMIQLIGESGKCCIDKAVDESALSRVEFVKYAPYGSKLPYYVIDTKFIKLFNINENIKYVKIHFIATSQYEVDLLKTKIGIEDNIECAEIGDVNIESYFIDGITGFLIKKGQLYKADKDGDINITSTEN